MDRFDQLETEKLDRNNALKRKIYLDNILRRPIDCNRLQIRAHLLTQEVELVALVADVSSDRTINVLH